MFENLGKSAQTWGLVGLSMLAAPAALGDDEITPLSERPPAAGTDPDQRTAATPILPDLPEKPNKKQLRDYALALKAVLKNDPEAFPQAVSRMEPFTRGEPRIRPIPFGFMTIIRHSQIDHTIPIFKELFSDCAKEIASTNPESVNQCCTNLQAIIGLFKYDFPNRAVVKDMLDDPSLRSVMESAAASPETDTARLLGVGQTLTATKIGSSQEVTLTYAGYIRSIHTANGNDVTSDTYHSAIEHSLNTFSGQRDSTLGGLRSLTDLVNLTRTVCKAQEQREIASKLLVSAPARFIAAENTLRQDRELKNTPEETALISALIGAYTEGIKEFHTLPDSRDKERIRYHIFDCGAHLEHIGTPNADHFLDVMQMEYLDKMPGDPAGIEQFITSVNPFQRDLHANDSRWGQYPLMRVLAANKDYFTGGIEALHQEVLENPSVSEKLKSLSRALDITEWFIDVEKIRFKGTGPFTPNAEYAAAFYEMVGHQRSTAVEWIRSDIFTAQEDFLPATLLLAIAPEVSPQSRDVENSREQQWLLEHLERACWLEARINPDSALAVQEAIFERASTTESLENRAALYRLLKPAVYLELNAAEPRSDVSEFLTGQVTQETNPQLLRHLAGTLCMGMHLEDTMQHSEDAPERYLSEFGIEQATPYRLTSESGGFVFMEGVVNFEKGEQSLRAMLDSRDSAGSEWQKSYYDLFAIAQGDLKMIDLHLDDAAEMSVAQFRHNALMVLGYSELEQESASYKSAVITHLERHLTEGTPHQWGEKVALLFELYESELLHSAAENEVMQIERKAQFLKEQLFGDDLVQLKDGGTQEKRPAIDTYLDGLLLQNGVRTETLMNADEDARKELLRKHEISAIVPQLEMSVGFIGAIHESARRRGMQFMGQMGFSGSDLNNPEDLIRILKKK